MSDSGKLGVRVFTSRAQLPVEGATVLITRKRSPMTGKYDVLSTQKTDSSGNIRPVSIPAPAPGESTAPYGIEPPFTRCDVWVEHPDYEVMLIRSVQIFPGVESVQLVELVPLVPGEPLSDRFSVRPIPYQTL